MSNSYEFSTTRSQSSLESTEAAEKKENEKKLPHFELTGTLIQCCMEKIARARGYCWRNRWGVCAILYTNDFHRFLVSSFLSLMLSLAPRILFHTLIFGQLLNLLGGYCWRNRWGVCAILYTNDFHRFLVSSFLSLILVVIQNSRYLLLGLVLTPDRKL